MLIYEASPIEICDFFGLWGWIGVGDDDRVIGIAGFRREEGRVWGFLDLKGKPPSLTLIRSIKRKLQEVGEPVYVACDEGNHPTATKLLGLIGFVPIDETLLGMRIWKWRH